MNHFFISYNFSFDRKDHFLLTVGITAVKPGCVLYGTMIVLSSFVNHSETKPEPLLLGDLINLSSLLIMPHLHLPHAAVECDAGVITWCLQVRSLNYMESGLPGSLPPPCAPG